MATARHVSWARWRSSLPSRQAYEAGVGGSAGGSTGGHAGQHRGTGDVAGCSTQHEVISWAFNVPSQHVPAKTPIAFGTGNIAGMMKKIHEFNTEENTEISEVVNSPNYNLLPNQRAFAAPRSLVCPCHPHWVFGCPY